MKFHIMKINKNKEKKKYIVLLPFYREGWNKNNFNFPGNSTNASIHAGIIGGVSNEIMGFINQINYSCYIL